jgi:hypothetical protein
MKRRGKLIWATMTLGFVVAVVLVRGPLGRTRPDLMALVSFDGGPLTFSRTYRSGNVGPFRVGDTRAETVNRLLTQHVLAQDMPQLQTERAEWALSLPAVSGGYVTYTITFSADRVTSVRAFYSHLSGL